MNDTPEPGRPLTNPGRDSDSGAIDRYLDDGGPEAQYTTDRTPDAPTPAWPTDRDGVDPGRVVMGEGCTPHSFQVYHRDIPELHADGATRCEAAANLSQDLAREIEGVADNYRRGLFGRVLDDVRAFVEQGS